MTYKIIKFVRDGDNEEVMNGLSLKEAQAYCSREDTHGEGWFCGYTKEASDETA